MHSRLQEEQWKRREHSPNEGYTKTNPWSRFHSFYQGEQSRKKSIVLHAEGRRFEPYEKHFRFVTIIFLLGG